MDDAARKPLECLVGEWESSGRTVPGRFGPSIAIRGTDVYEWFGSGFLVHRVDVTMGEERIRVLEMIGEYDPPAGSYTMRAFDSSGTASTMKATVDSGGVWTFADATTRAFLTIDPDGRTMAARWERLDEGEWHHWMDMRFRR